MHWRGMRSAAAGGHEGGHRSTGSEPDEVLWAASSPAAAGRTLLLRRSTIPRTHAVPIGIRCPRGRVAAEETLNQVAQHRPPYLVLRHRGRIQEASPLGAVGHDATLVQPLQHRRGGGQRDAPARPQGPVNLRGRGLAAVLQDLQNGELNPLGSCTVTPL